MATTLGNINLFVSDIERTRRFYLDVVGLAEDEERSHAPSFYLLDAGGCTITLQDRSAPGAAFDSGNSIELGFAVDDLEGTRSHLQAWGARVSEIQQMGWGRGFDAVDPDGHRLTFYRMRD
jgi:predicted enzyme related to lactoylglutathione lyase